MIGYSREQLERADHAFYDVSQTFLSEFESGEPDLYPTED